MTKTEAGPKASPRVLLCCAAEDRFTIAPAVEQLARAAVPVDFVAGVETDAAPLDRALKEFGDQAFYVLCRSENLDRVRITQLQRLLQRRGVSDDRVFSVPLLSERGESVANPVLERIRQGKADSVQRSEPPPPPKQGDENDDDVNWQDSSAASTMPSMPDKSDLRGPTKEFKKTQVPTSTARRKTEFMASPSGPKLPSVPKSKPAPAARPKPSSASTETAPASAAPTPTAGRRPPPPKSLQPKLIPSPTSSTAKPQPAEPKPAAAPSPASTPPPAPSGPPPTPTSSVAEPSGPPPASSVAKPAGPPPAPSPAAAPTGPPPIPADTGGLDDEDDLEFSVGSARQKRLMFGGIAAGVLAVLGIVAVVATGGDDESTVAQAEDKEAAPEPEEKADPPPEDPEKAPAEPEPEAPTGEAAPTQPEPPEPETPSQPEPPPVEPPSPDEGAQAADEPPVVTADQVEALNHALRERAIRALDDVTFAAKASKPMRFADAVTYCEELDIRGLTAWRLPTSRELRRLNKADLIRVTRYWTNKSRRKKQYLFNARSKRAQPVSKRYRGGRALCIRDIEA